ncbi:MAG: DNA repair protein RadA [Actinomycetota bacterium]
MSSQPRADGVRRSATPGGYACADCGHGAPKWFGRCPGCGAWSTAAEVAREVASGRQGAGSPAVEVVTLSDHAKDWGTRVPGLPEVDRVLGGGLVPGGAVLLAGEPGIGKSTLVLQWLDSLNSSGRRCLLVTGEESTGQVGLRAARLGLACDRIKVATTTSVPAILSACESERPEVLVVDSIQTLDAPDIDQGPGSTVQVRECAAALVRFAKATGTAIVMVGHVTKDGSVAGPKVLEHVVDAVATLEGERSGSVRLLRAAKNRFGSCDETGVFTMSEQGLRAVPDPSAMLLADRQRGVSGSVVFCGLEGTRPVLVEVQALLSHSDQMHPRRVAIGVDARRLTLLLGILHKRLELRFGSSDVFVAAAGGLAVREPGVDLPLALALWSSARDLPVGEDLVAIGEVGLGGEIRRVPAIERRLNEARRLGFKRAVVPPGTCTSVRGMRVFEVADLQGALDAARAPHAVS